MPLLKSFLFISFLLISSGFSIGQIFNQPNAVIGADIYTGFILRHKPQIGHLITDHPKGFRMIYERKNYGKRQWQQRFNFPDVGATFTYVNYGDDRLGETFSLIPHYSFYIRKNKLSANQLKYSAGIGLAYNTEKYDREFNNKNNVLSTAVSIGVLLQVTYQRELMRRLFMNMSLAMTHFSNGAIKRPNSGINVMSTNLGFSYMINYTPEEYVYTEEKLFTETKIGYTLTLSSGIHEYARIGTGQYPFFVVTALSDLQINRKSAIGVALEWFASFSMKKDIADRFQFGDKEPPDWHRIGIALSHELFINDLSVITQAGYYLYDEFNYYGKLYLRVGLRKYLNDSLYGSFSVKSHAAKAEAAELGLGWRIK